MQPLFKSKLSHYSATWLMAILITLLAAIPLSVQAAPALVPALSATAVVTGAIHTCALTDGGAVFCWGDNSYGQAGTGSYTPQNSNTPLAVSSLSSGVIALASGLHHTCALKDSGAVVCWGKNEGGNLGDGTYTNSNTPVAVSGLSSGVTAIAAGFFHTCAVMDNGTVKCWGWGGDGQLGDGTGIAQTTPVAVNGLSGSVIAIAAPAYSTCALTSDGAVYCWGDGGAGQLGHGAFIHHSMVPVAVNGLSSDVTTIASGGYHTCALTSGGAMKCWGHNQYGQLGDGMNTHQNVPVAVSGLGSGVTAIAGGMFHTCAVTSGGAVQCWGLNLYSQLGDGTNTDQLTPVNVIGLTSGGTKLAGGEAHTCAVTSDGVAQCWGSNGHGQLGNGTHTSSNAPVNVVGFTGPTTPNLSIPNSRIDVDNGSFRVPVNFTSDGASIASVAFSLSYDESCLTFDAANSGPSTTLPSDFAADISEDTPGQLEFSLLDDLGPVVTLADGPLFDLAFTVEPTCIPTDGTDLNVAFSFGDNPAPSFGDSEGKDVDGTSSDVTIPLRFNVTPTAIQLSPNSINENQPSGTMVGTLSTTDLNASDSHAYTLVSGTGDTDNASFELDGATLKTKAAFDFEAKNSYTVRIHTDDGGLNGTFEQSLTINVTNVNEAPTAVDDTPDPVTTVFVGGQATTINVLANDTDPENDTLTVASVDTTGSQGSVSNNGTNVSYTAPNSNGSSSFTYQASDGALTSNSATVYTTYVKNDPRGDCNANGSITAADFIATVLEIFDTNDTPYNTNPAWWLIYNGDYIGSPRGCDSNASENGLNHTSDSVKASDIICTVLIFFNRTCGSGTVVAASSATPAQLTVTSAAATAGQSVPVTVSLDTGSNPIAAVTFALAVDTTKVSFDATDANQDGVPDAVVLSVPASMSKSVTWNAAKSRLEVAIFGASLPLPTLSDGPLATITFTVPATATSGTSELSLQLVSLSDTEGQDLVVGQSSSTMTITGTAVTPGNSLYLPVIVR